MTLKIIPFQNDPNQLMQLLDLHQIIFSKFCESYIAPDFSESITFLGLDGTKVIGFACYERMGNGSNQNFYQDILGMFTRSTPNQRGRYFDGIMGQFRGNPTLTLFDPPSIELIVHTWDYDFTDFGIHEAHRRNGLGRGLAEHVLLDALKDASSYSIHEPTNMFACLIAESEAYTLAQNLGFVPLMKVTPGYYDGSSLIAMVKKLK